MSEKFEVYDVINSKLQVISFGVYCYLVFLYYLFNCFYIRGNIGGVKRGGELYIIGIAQMGKSYVMIIS